MKILYIWFSNIFNKLFLFDSFVYLSKGYTISSFYLYSNDESSIL